DPPVATTSQPIRLTGMPSSRRPGSSSEPQHCHFNRTPPSRQADSSPSPYSRLPQHPFHQLSIGHRAPARSATRPALQDLRRRVFGDDGQLIQGAVVAEQVLPVLATPPVLLLHEPHLVDKEVAVLLHLLLRQLHLPGHFLGQLLDLGVF